MRSIDIRGLHCLYSQTQSKDKIAYILYPMDTLSDWVNAAAKRYGVTIVDITGMDWQNVFSPWPAKGVPKGSPDFKGYSAGFLSLLQNVIVPEIETRLGIDDAAERSLIGVSMSGLFAMWQWIVCDTFHNIASLSGSFWYEGFLRWIESQSIPHKTGKGFFLLGNKEPKSKIKIFSTVGTATDTIIWLLKEAGINVEFESVHGNHYSAPIPRLDKAFTALYNEAHRK